MGLRCVDSRKREKRSGICRCKTVRRDRNRHRLTGRNWICAGFGGETKAIAISGYHSAADVEIGKMCGFDYHLTKPFDYHALRTILSEFSGSGTPRAGEDQTSFGSDRAAS